jgi:nucleoside-diphosphate-sugar epimerase
MGQTGSNPADEDEPLHPDTDYGKSKVEAEKAVKEICSHTNFSYMVRHLSYLDDTL